MANSNFYLFLILIDGFLDDIYNAISTHILPLMKEKYIFGDEHVLFFTELTVTTLESGRAEFSSLFSFFCLDEKVNPKFVQNKSIVLTYFDRLLYCRLSFKYLSQLLRNNQFIPSLSLCLNNYQTILIQSWFRYVFSFFRFFLFQCWAGSTY